MCQACTVKCLMGIIFLILTLAVTWMVGIIFIFTERGKPWAGRLVICPKAEPLSLCTIDLSGLIILCCSVCHRILRSTPGVCPLDASPHPSCLNKFVSRHCFLSWIESRLQLSENHSPKSASFLKKENLSSNLRSLIWDLRAKVGKVPCCSASFRRGQRREGIAWETGGGLLYGRHMFVWDCKGWENEEPFIQKLRGEDDILGSLTPPSEPVMSGFSIEAKTVPDALNFCIPEKCFY